MESAPCASSQQPRLLDRLRDKIRVKHYSIRTEHAYVDWVRRFILFHGKRHPMELGAEGVEAFLTHLAVAGRVSASTQNQAKSALVFLYKEVMGSELPWLQNVENARRPQRLPVVLVRDEVASLLSWMTGSNGLVARLLYGSGLRLMEAVRLRCTSGIWPKVWERSGCPSPWSASIRAPFANGPGSMSSRPNGYRKIRDRVRRDAITSMSKMCSARCARCCARREFTSPQRPTRAG